MSCARKASADVFMQSFFLPFVTLQTAVEERKSPAINGRLPGEPNSMLYELRLPGGGFSIKSETFSRKFSLSK
jgi:hypothetical protein